MRFINLVKPLITSSLLGMSGAASATPLNAHEVNNGSSWACDVGFRKQGQQCNPLYVPLNARLKGQGWECVAGYQRKSNQCNPTLSNVVATPPQRNAKVNQAESLFLLGYHKQAFKAFLPLAKEGDASAQFYLAELYQTDSNRLDKNRAIYWYKKSAAQGNPNAQFNLANAYYEGTGVSANLPQAANWYELAAKSGVPEAQLNLGYMYSRGRGVKRNDKLASLWYKVAAERGNAKAQSNLGYRYCNGVGVEKSLQQCAFWVKKAMDQRHPNAQKIWNAFELKNHFDGSIKNIG